METTKSLLFSCSIDDGHPSDMKALELLQRHEINATFFVPIRNREGARVLAKTDLRELARHAEIGSHTHDHCFLRSLNLADAQFQVVEGKKRLEDMLGQSVAGFCYPGGKYRRVHTTLVKNAGFRYARSTVNLRFDRGQRQFEMPTTLQFYPHQRNVYLRNFVKGGTWPQRWSGLRVALQHEDWIGRMYAMFEHARKHGGVFHLWGHSKDIDELNAWQHLDQFLTYVASRVAKTDRLSNQQLAAHGSVDPGATPD